MHAYQTATCQLSLHRGSWLASCCYAKVCHTEREGEQPAGVHICLHNCWGVHVCLFCGPQSSFAICHLVAGEKTQLLVPHALLPSPSNKAASCWLTCAEPCSLRSSCSTVACSLPMPSPPPTSRMAGTSCNRPYRQQQQQQQQPARHAALSLTPRHPTTASHIRASCAVTTPATEFRMPNKPPAADTVCAMALRSALPNKPPAADTVWNMHHTVCQQRAISVHLPHVQCVNCASSQTHVSMHACRPASPCSPASCAEHSCWAASC